MKKIIDRLSSREFLYQSLFAATALALATLVFAHLVFGRFFIGTNNVGHDYAGGLTGFLAEYYWSISEGPWTPPWFTPAFCGGIPMYADPVNSFFALPSVLMRLLHINPLLSSYVTFLVAVGVGTAGMFLFVTRRLGASLAAAAVAAVVFGLNGFLSSRMMVGHTMYHGLMLIPWLALLISGDSRTPGTSPNPRHWRATLSTALVAGWILAYWVYSGGGVMIVAFGLAALALIALAWRRGTDVGEGLLRGTLACMVGLLLAASKISAALSYMASFPRSGYLLPGFRSIGDTLWVTLRALFADPSNIAGFAAERMVNMQWFQDRHELEYGVTWIPAVLLLLALVASLQRSPGEPTSPAAPVDASSRRPAIATRSIGLLIAVIVAIPLVLNTFFSPQWNAFLKSLPLIGSSSALLRWFIVYVPLIAVLSGLAVDRIVADPLRRALICVIAIAGLMLSVASVDRGFYAQQPYDPRPVLQAFDAAKSDPKAKPTITHVGAIIDQNGTIVMPLNRQDLLVNGISQLACYIPIFGYRLEFFPFRSLHPGSVYETGPDGFNMKDPACFLFPSENNCRAGDHFATSRRADLERFTQYQDFPFRKSMQQTVADSVSLLALLLSVLFVLWRLVAMLRAQKPKDA